MFSLDTLNELQRKTEDPNFWNDRETSEEIIKDYTCHVIEFYFLMKPRGSQELNAESYGWNREHEERFWIPLEELPQIDLRPEFLRTRMPEILKSNALLHIVNDSRK